MSLQALPYDLTGKRVWVAGHRGMVGSAIVRRLAAEGCDVLTVDRRALDLTEAAPVRAWMGEAKPQAVFLAAARVGGIHANDAYPAEFLRDNLAIELNVIEAAHGIGVEKLLYLGSSCIYPRDTAQPMREEQILTGPLEPTNEWYAVAKIAGLKLCQAYRRQYGCDFIAAMPTNLYGPGDNFHPEHSHVPAALLQRLHDAASRGDETVTVWGTGAPLREFMHVDDLADACVFLMKNYSDEAHVNVGTGEEISIGDFAAAIARVVGFRGTFAFDTSRPDGSPRKLLDTSRLTALGWRPSISLADGLAGYYEWFVANQAALRSA